MEKNQNKICKKVRAIIYTREKGKIYFLILNRILRWKGWEILKETIEKNETPRQALIRGIQEETKIKNYKIIKKLDFKENWEKDGIDYRIVATYLVEADKNDKISLKQEIIEHKAYRWVDKKAAIKKLTWPKTKQLIQKLDIV